MSKSFNIDPDLPPAKLVCTSDRDRRRTRSSLPATDLKRCSICQEEKRDARNRRKMEKSIRCEGDSTPETLLSAAQIRGHHRIILETDQQDLWARDILYHISCYKNFTSPRALQLIIEKKVAEEEVVRRSEHSKNSITWRRTSSIGQSRSQIFQTCAASTWSA